MLKTLHSAVYAVILCFGAITASAQVNLTAHTTGVGTAVHTTITALGEIAADRGIANIQIKEAKPVQNMYVEGKVDIGTLPFVYPLCQSSGPYQN